MFDNSDVTNCAKLLKLCEVLFSSMFVTTPPPPAMDEKDFCLIACT